jgi:hypothetical protein
MYKELQYLREELNQRVIAHIEQTSKAINTVLVIWSGAFAILGTGAIKFVEITLENIPLYFLGATIFFISNIILYFAARQYHFFADELFKLGAYIAVFYEKQPSRKNKVGKNFSWELINFKFMKNNLDNSTKYKKNFYNRNDEYKVLILISLVPIIFLSLVFIIFGKMNIIIHIFLSIICVFYFVFSIILYHTVQKYTSLKDNYDMKVRHLNAFFQYSLDTGHYTKNQIKNRFGDTYEICKRHLQNQKVHV